MVSVIVLISNYFNSLAFKNTRFGGIIQSTEKTAKCDLCGYFDLENIRDHAWGTIE
jgi:hypothetical protein